MKLTHTTKRSPAMQTQGFQQQALADAVVAYATNIDNLGALEGAVKKVRLLN